MLSVSSAQILPSSCRIRVEAKYIKTIWNWRRACDERGLSECTRSRFNYHFLNLLLDELMPWHTETYDFSLLEVNRYAFLKSMCE